jgi:hypothetical protein
MSYPNHTGFSGRIVREAKIELAATKLFGLQIVRGGWTGPVCAVNTFDRLAPSQRTRAALHIQFTESGE